MKFFPNYVSGSFVEGNSRFGVFNPHDNSLLGESSFASLDEADVAVKNALSVRNEFQNLPTYKIAEALTQIADSLKKDQQRLSEILANESGKPIRYALGEIDRSVQTFLVAAEESKRIESEYVDLEWASAAVNKEGLVKRFPVGVVLGITPFNFPLNLVAHKVAPAIASRCPIIIKPSPRTPIMAYELAKIVDQTDLPKGVLSVLNLNNEDIEKLVKDDRLAMVSFTGSDKVGWYLKSISGKKKIALELGGNAGVIVSDSADITHAVNRCLIGGFAYSGQVCIHTQRIYVHGSIYETFKEEFVRGTQQLKVGDPLDETTEIAGLIDEDNAKRVEQWVNEAVQSGAQLLCGGKRYRSYFEPTVLTNTQNTMKVCCNEVFGPVVIIEKFDDYDQALKAINNSDFGLQAGIFTDSQHEIATAFNELEVGGLVVNDVPTFRVDHMPYGGVKNSGFGREGLKYAILEMTEPRILVQNKR